MTLGAHSDRAYKELKAVYGVEGEEDGDVLITKTTLQPTKPLMVFKNPRPEARFVVTFQTSEFTSLCPRTGQPDFAEVSISYIPKEYCVEMKALKLYLQSYRNEGHFLEEITNLIFEDLMEVLDPRWLDVEVEFNIRGGTEAFCERIYDEEKEKE